MKIDLKMGKSSVILLACQLAVSAAAMDFFGIEHNGNTADNVINLICGLAEGRPEVVQEYQNRLEKTDAYLAKKIKTDELQIPCVVCMGGSNANCSACSGTGRVADPYSLGYLQHKFSTAVEAGMSERASWKEAKAAFDKRRAVVLEGFDLFGTVIRKEDRGLLLSQEESEEPVYLEGIDPSISEGTPIVGQVWPNGMHSYTNDAGSLAEAKSYTAALWVD